VHPTTALALARSHAPLPQVLQGQPQKYAFVLQQLKNGTDSVLLRIFLALQRCTGDIVADAGLHEELASAALGVRFRPLPDDAAVAVTAAQVALASAPSSLSTAAMLCMQTAEAWSGLAIALVSSSPGMLHATARSVVRALGVAQAEADAYATLATGSADGFTPASASAVSARLTAFNQLVYNTLARLLLIVPTGASVLFSAFQEAAPPSGALMAAHIAYARHALTLAGAGSLPVLRDRLLASLVDRMVEADAAIQLELLPEEEEEGGEGEEEAKAGASPAAPATDAAKATIERAARLDELSLLLFRFLHAHMCGCAGEEEEEEGGALLPLLPSFDNRRGVRTMWDPVLDSDAGLECVTTRATLAAAEGVEGKEGGSVSEAGGRTGRTASIAHSVDSALPPALPPVCRTAEGAAEREHLFALMLGVFERSVLLAHRSKFTQFALFYTAALGGDLTDRVVGRLIAQVRAYDKPPLTRATCASYLGSFLARSAFLDDATLRSALFYTLEWAHGWADLHAAHAEYHDRNEGRGAGRVQDVAGAAGGEGEGGSLLLPITNRAATLRLHPHALRLDPELPALPPLAVFRALLQAACYTLVFRASTLRARAGGLEFLRSLAWGRLAAHPLDPLAHCAPAVSREFIRTAYALRLASAEELQASAAWEGGGSPVKSKEGSSGVAGEAAEIPAHLLDSFFPFDPFLLRSSSRFISPLYRSWGASALPLPSTSGGGGLWESDTGYDTGMTSGVATPAHGGGGRARAGLTSGSEAGASRHTPGDSSDEDDEEEEEEEERDEEEEEDEEEDEGASLLDTGLPPDALASMTAVGGGVGLFSGPGAGSGLLSRMRAGFSLGPSLAVSLGVSLAPGLTAAVVGDGAGRTEDLLAGLDIDFLGEDGEGEEGEEDTATEGRPRRLGSLASGASGMSSSSKPSTPLFGARPPLAGLLVAALPRLVGAATRRGRGAGGSTRARGGVAAIGGRPPLASSQGGASDAPAAGIDSPTVLRLRMRGLSVDESAYYASLMRGGGGAGAEVLTTYPAMGGIEEEEEGRAWRRDSAVSSGVQSTASVPALPMAEVTTTGGTPGKRRRLSSASSSASCAGLSPENDGEGGAADLGQPPRSSRLSVGLSPFDPTGVVPPSLAAAAARAAEEAAGASGRERSSRSGKAPKTARTDAGRMPTGGGGHRKSDGSTDSSAPPPPSEGVAPEWNLFQTMMMQAADGVGRTRRAGE